MPTRPSVLVAVLLAVAMPLAGCQNGDNSNQTALQPTVVQPTLSTKTFSGTVDVNSQVNTNFTTVDAGTLAVTLTSAGPPATLTVGLYLGQPSTTDASQCINGFGLSGTTQASTTPQISVTAPAGAYCVAIAELGNATGPVNFTFTVTGAFGSQSATDK